MAPINAFDSQTFNVAENQLVKRDGFSVCICQVFEGGVQVEVTCFNNISQYTQKECQQPEERRGMGPGRLYTGSGKAFYMNNGCVVERQIIDNAMLRPLTVTASVETQTDAGDTVSVLVINEGRSDETMTRLTGATSSSIGPGRVVTYSSGTITTESRTFTGISEFSVVETGTDGRLSHAILDSSVAQRIIQGPGQLYVGADEAVFIEPEIATFVNQETANDLLQFNSILGTDMTGVVDIINTPVTTISGGTLMYEIPGVSSSIYDVGQERVTITSAGGRVHNFDAIMRYTVVDNNEVTINPPAFDFSTGGVMFTDSTENTALFATNSNPAIIQMMSSFTPQPEDASYGVETDSNGVRNLMREIGSPPDTEIIQTITGSYVMSVGSSEDVVYVYNEVRIQDFFGRPRVRIEQVDILFTNTESNPTSPSGIFSNSSLSPFSGPGTFSYSRGTGFYTQNGDLGSEVSSQSSTAPIPRLGFDRELIRTNIIDGVDYAMSTVPVTIGGDRVIDFEAASYNTSTGQEVLYSGGVVSVHRPIITQGHVIFNNGDQELFYIDTNGFNITRNRITTLHAFSGGDVTTTGPPPPRTPPITVTLEGPGKLYISDDGKTATFSTSDIITSYVANLIRETPTDFEVEVDQLSSIFCTGVFNLSIYSATVTYPGGGVIWSSRFNDTSRALYIDDYGTETQIQQAVSSLLPLTKHIPSKDNGILHLIFNGREIYTYSPRREGREFPISSDGSFILFFDMTIWGCTLPGGPYTGYNKVITFNGIEVKEFNSIYSFQVLFGFGYLVLPENSDKAFYTNYPPAISYLYQSIQNVRKVLFPPRIRLGVGSIMTMNRFDTVFFGTNVTVFEDADITFECNMEAGRPEPSVAFYRVFPDGTEIMLNNTMDEIVIANNTLTLLNIRMDDAGEYECRASNGVPEDAMASSTLTVREAGEYFISGIENILALASIYTTSVK